MSRELFAAALDLRKLSEARMGVLLAATVIRAGAIDGPADRGDCLINGDGEFPPILTGGDRDAVGELGAQPASGTNSGHRSDSARRTCCGANSSMAIRG